MARPKLLETLRAAAGHVLTHPDTVLDMAKHALGRRVPIPVDALRWALAELPRRGGRPRDLVIDAAPPALRIDGVFEFMGQEVRARASLHVLSVRLGADVLCLELRVADLTAEALVRDTPLDKLLRSGALDLKNPAKLLGFLKKKPRVIARAEGDVFELDLLEVPKLRENRRLRRVLATISPVVKVKDVRTEGRFLLVSLVPTPEGLREAVAAARGR